ncbi:MAG: deoxynucleoside kinase [Gammaproteobacteria bacterium]|nr:deoxynucleoside kinase [Gammaproteobacteria bacterium]
MTDRPDFIVIEGPIGVGKTTLARRLAETYGCDLLLEGAEENPFLSKFYDNPKSAAFPTQLFFLLQRARQLQELRQSDLFNPVRISDFLMEKDRLFAELTLTDDELGLYEQVYQQLTLDVPEPDLVIYLQAPVHILRDRISQRGIGYEQQIESAYLERLTESYVSFFHHYTNAPLLIVNSEDCDFVNNSNDYNLLLNQINSRPRGRSYFNPTPLDMS